eukprot:TRINITY_DN2961_c0_g1_i1.p1 TRINITY_DN2961_c0_g1~~TRINITY_DN2961_c0_g1_i1.p1  ORF type:complete len:188 (-),score=-29.49 TRINITY_DN2961_c0_g1_i1:224-787(-)
MPSHPKSGHCSSITLLQISYPISILCLGQIIDIQTVIMIPQYYLKYHIPPKYRPVFPHHHVINHIFLYNQAKHEKSKLKNYIIFKKAQNQIATLSRKFIVMFLVKSSMQLQTEQQLLQFQQQLQIFFIYFFERSNTVRSSTLFVNRISTLFVNQTIRYIYSDLELIICVSILKIKNKIYRTSQLILL